MKTIYLDLFSGISGDMFIGALIDLGVNLRGLQDELAKLKLEGYHLHSTRQQRSHIEGTKFDVHLEEDHHHEEHNHAHAHSHQHEHGQHEHEHGQPHHHHHEHEDHDHGQEDHSHPHAPGDEHGHGRNFAEIKQLIAQSALSSWVKQRAVATFQRLATAEGKIHGQPAEEVHFHEVGAVDSIVDIVGACVALEMLGKPRLLASPVVDGTGWIDCAHGCFPIPAPATLEILSARGVTVSQCDEPHELVTPTGAALLAELVESFGPMENVATTKIGYGLGTRENKTRPNVLRALLGDSSVSPENDWQRDTVVTLQTNLDDINSEVLGCFVEQAMTAGALDVFFTPIQMKKNRPGILLTVLCPPAEADRFTELMLRETTAFGVRRHTSERRKLHREMLTAKTPYGEVAVKVGKLNGQVVQLAPEFGSCKQLAEQAGIPLKQIYEAAIKATKP